MIFFFTQTNGDNDFFMFLQDFIKMILKASKSGPSANVSFYLVGREEIFEITYDVKMRS